MVATVVLASVVALSWVPPAVIQVNSPPFRVFQVAPELQLSVIR